MHTHMYKKNDVEVELCHQVYNDSSCISKRVQQATDQSRAVSDIWMTSLTRNPAGGRNDGDGSALKGAVDSV